MHEYDVLIIGAGGAGMMCAFQAALRGRRVCLVDHSQKIGRKILISGGGRCNFTNIHATAENYVSKNPHFCKSALSRFTPEDFIRLVKKHRISFHEKKLGQLFCDGSADAIVKLLLAECDAAGVVLKPGCTVSKIVRDDSKFRVEINGERIICESLVVATGGLSIPKIGATGFGYEIARQFGLPIVTTFPALVGFDFTAADQKRWSELAGVSVESDVSCNGASFRENILFTHTGISGPAILQASLYWNAGQSISIDLAPTLDIEAFFRDKKISAPKQQLKTVVGEVLPKRLAEKFAQQYAPSVPLAEVSDKLIADFASQLKGFEIVPAGNFGYGKAEVTRGGVDTDSLSSKNMECKKVPGLYFIGEVVDVTGQLGGFNFQWAWASAFAAAQTV